MAHLLMPQTTPISQDDARRFFRVHIAKEMGWTLEYVDSLSAQDWHDVQGVIQALNRYRNIELDAARFRAGKKK
ncbi:hypothetical protein G4Y79_15315 [Phototrophicus methaneseepsis]|uniref:Phage protein n=1 Tax=Phototrophicus methaneseepsis TaxID=2710758 RepID=A0A7S8ID09_9CHLR|nr:hypothetical protein [Phototrophicus methaneseepsis]QPC81072.1 hypothetical protein G4Y79_15315 [Phototrophicus methaneseepsis]